MYSTIQMEDNSEFEIKIITDKILEILKGKSYSYAKETLNDLLEIIEDKSILS